MSRYRTLDEQEQAMWQRVIATVKPIHAPVKLEQPEAKPAPRPKPSDPARNRLRQRSAKKTPSAKGAAKVASQAERERAVAAQNPANNLNSHWDRRFQKGQIMPDVTIDLHGVCLSGAYARLDGALEQAVHHKLRVILLITGKPRRHDRASGQGRGAIASVVHDWLTASRHASHISAVKNAHPRHGGAGALYIILKR